MATNIYNNPVMEPDWLKLEPWHADQTANAATVRYIDAMEDLDEVKETTLFLHDLGAMAFPSGKLVADSFCMNMDDYLEGDQDCLKVPAGPCQIRLITSGNEKYSEAAYLTLRWSPRPENAKYAVIARSGINNTTNEGGVFFVDKGLMGLFDMQAFRTHLPDVDRLDQFILQNIGIVDEAYKKTETPSGFILDARKGIAIAILEYATPDTPCALHFDFLQLHGPGDDGEYDPDSPYLPVLKALREKEGYKEA